MTVLPEPVRPTIDVRPPRVVRYGESTPEQRDAWLNEQANGPAPERLSAERSEMTCYGYVWGWLDALRAAKALTPEQDAFLVDAVLPFSREYGYDKWLFVMERQTSLPPYMDAWRDYLRAQGMTALLGE